MALSEAEELELLSLERERGVQPEKKTEGLFGTAVGENSELLRKARIPSQKVAEASTAMMDSFEPESRSVALNALARIPQTMHSISGDIVSSAISPENAVVMGLLKGGKLAAPAIKALGRFVGQGAEKLSGLSYKTPGVLADVVENPSLPFKPGIEAANEIYASKADPTKIRDTFKATLGKKELVEGAMQALKEGNLTPDEALIARQTLDSIKNQIPRVSYFSSRNALNELAKTKFAGADEAYRTAVKAENLRNVLPINKTGTPSIVKSALGIGGAFGGGISPYAPVVAPAVSPAIQAGIASGIGVTKKAISPLVENPKLAALSEIIRREIEKKNK